MSQIATQQANQLQQLKAIACQLDKLPHNQRSQFITSQASHLGISRQTLYGWLKKKVGWFSGRKKRQDAGTTVMSEAVLIKIGAMQKADTRKNGKRILSTPVARSILINNDEDIPVSNPQLNRLLRDRGMSGKQQATATPHIKMRSLHPNHTHQVDPSLCVLYYIKGKQHIMEADKFYKNKPDNYSKVLKVWRYVLWDHTSSYIVPWYVESAGENPENLFLFLMFAWGLRSDRDFHGVPIHMIWDLGSANTSASIKSLLDSLEVKHIPHKRGNARAKGGVEGANNIVECQFESRLKFCPVDSVEELNAAALAWANTYNANCIRGQDCRLHRRGLSTPTARSDLWHKITASQLRLLPDEAICRGFMTGKAQTRKVKQDMTISFKHPKLPASALYDLTGCNAVNADDKVEVCPIIYGEGLIKVTVYRHNDEPLCFKLEPITNFDPFGFRQDAPVFGESFASQPKTDQQKTANQLDIAAYGDLSQKDMDKAKDKAVPFAGLDSFEHLKRIELPSYLPRQGSQITSGQRFDEKPMSSIAAAKILKTELGGRYNPFHLNYLKLHFQNGITSAELEALIVQFNQSNVSSKKGANHA